MSKSIWHGDSTDGIELRYQEDDKGVEFLDEVCMYHDGDCVFHLELMNDVSYWIGLYAAKHTAHVNIASKNLRSYIEAIGEGWPDENAKRAKLRRRMWNAADRLVESCRVKGVLLKARYTNTADKEIVVQKIKGTGSVPPKFGGFKIAVIQTPRKPKETNHAD